MRTLQLRVETPEICINGHMFALQLTDLELYSRAQALLECLTQLDKQPRTAEELLAATGDVAALLEAALGAGAMGIIGDGKPVNLPLAIEWLGALAQEAAQHYTDIALDDEDD